MSFGCAGTMADDDGQKMSTPEASTSATSAKGTAASTESPASGTASSASKGAGAVVQDPAAALTDECGLHTKFLGDQYCLKAPPADKGFQIHIGPSDYENPDPKFILEPGGELTESWTGTSSNDKDVYYFYHQQHMRPGSHHLLITAASAASAASAGSSSGNARPAAGGGFGGELIVASQNPISDEPAGGKIAPEDMDVGKQLKAHSPLFGSLHFINTTDKPILKEVWVNFWYKDADSVKEQARPIFTGTPINIPPGSHVLISADCPISGSGRILRLFGHKHANNVRWSTYRVRGDQRDLLFEDYDHWETPLILEYSSITQNPTPDRASKTPGGYSGVVDVEQGDTLRFECEVVNQTDKTFVGKNEALDDEMCIQNGTIVGASVMGFCPSQTVPVN